MQVVATQDQFHKEIFRLTNGDHRFQFDEAAARDASEYLIENWNLKFAPPYVEIPSDHPGQNGIMVSICKNAGGHIGEHADNTITHFLVHAIPAYIGDDDWDQ